MKKSADDKYTYVIVYFYNVHDTYHGVLCKACAHASEGAPLTVAIVAERPSATTSIWIRSLLQGVTPACTM